MTVASAQTIRRLNVFTPFHERQLNERAGKTYGLGPCTYDVTVEFDGEEDEVADASGEGTLPLGQLMVPNPCKKRWILMWRGRCVLASTREHFTMPNDYGAQVLDKSSWARKFVFVQNTWIDPGWSGYLTLEITCDSWWPRIIRLGDPIAQIVLFKLDEPTERPYNGKYQSQRRGPVLPIKERRT